MSRSRAAAGKRLAVVVLAAGKGTRLGAGAYGRPKVLVECLGLPLLEHVRRAIAPLHPDTTVLVTGYGADSVEAWAADAWPAAKPVRQIPQRGTGHALRLALEAIPRHRGVVLVAYGDVPQVRAVDLEALLQAHRRGAVATVLTGESPEPGRLGRVVRDARGRFREIVEARDAAGRPGVLGIREFNTGFYAFDADALRPVLRNLSRDNAQREEYATEAVNRLALSGQPVETVAAEDPQALLGVNTLEDLARAVGTVRRRILTDHLSRGVVVVDPGSTIVEPDVEIGPGARLLPFTYVQRGCRIAAGAVIGPFARLRGTVTIGERAEVGNFVEVKASTLEAGAKAKHLAYLGDAHVGPGANIGCGAITANYDGHAKHRTTIGARAHIGSGTVLVAPVTVGEGAVTGANAVVLAGRDVPPGATAVGVPARNLAPKPRRTPKPRAAKGRAGRKRKTASSKRR
jgi:bifunctional UDP-N-acetylglucosamine pyrophosphorylase/glucosamine-1-phosphate N-acetyltransferase